jgi:Uri superfamily endonuclease
MAVQHETVGALERRDTCRVDGQGTYLLLIQMKTKAEIAVGRLGTFAFPMGWYLYAGSALGPGGLRARLARHRRTQKRLHWHVDYLLQRGLLWASWHTASATRLECSWARAVLDLAGARIAIGRFGASDCHCASHLIYLANLPPDNELRRVLCAASGEPDTGVSTPHIRHVLYANSTAG